MALATKSGANESGYRSAVVRQGEADARGLRGLVRSVAFPPDRQAVNTLLVLKGWIAEGDTNVLRLTIDC